MKVAGIIAEYNPFHKGHAYHIRRTKELSGVDYIVVVMSPDYVQRGEPAILDKWSRTRSALMAGADLVLQLPVWNAAGSAEFFAQGAVAALEKLGIVDYISFGCESRSPELIAEAAAFFAMEKEPEDFKIRLREALKAGMTYPRARAEAYLASIYEMSGDDYYGKSRFQTGSGEGQCRHETSGSGLPGNSGGEMDARKREMAELLLSPNNILAIEYEKALLKMGSSIRPLPVIRVGAGYNDEKLDGDYSSASAVRRELREAGKITESVSLCLPDYSLEDVMDGSSSGRLLFPSDLDLPLSLRLYEFCSGRLPFHFQDLDKDLENRIVKLFPDYTGFEQFVSLLKSRQLTEARVRRALLHLLLDIRADDVEEYRAAGTALYIRILGFRKKSLPLLTAVSKNCSLPMISNLPGWEKRLDSRGRKMMASDLYASGLYSAMASHKSGTRAINEYRRKIVIVDSNN